MEQTLHGQVALVTGGGRGIGRACCLRLAQLGASVVVNDTGATTRGAVPPEFRMPAQDVVHAIREAGGRALAATDSATHPYRAQQLVMQCIDQYGRLDILVHAAGIQCYGRVGELTPHDWEAVLAVHLHAAYYLMAPAVRQMLQQGTGRIVLLSSGAAAGARHASAYAAAKAGLMGLCWSAALDLDGHGITVNALWPGAQTRLNPEEEATPEAVAELVAYLCLPEAGHLSGQCLSIRGAELGWVTPYALAHPRQAEGGGWTVAQLRAMLSQYE